MSRPRVSPLLGALFGVLAQLNVVFLPILGALMASRAYKGYVREWSACLSLAIAGGFLVHFYQSPVLNAVQSMQVSVTVMAAASILGVLSRHFGAVNATYFFTTIMLLLLPFAHMMPYGRLEYWHNQFIQSRFAHTEFVVVLGDKVVKLLAAHWLSLWACIVLLSLGLGLIWYNRGNVANWYKERVNSPILPVMVLVGMAAIVCPDNSYLPMAYPFALLACIYPAVSMLHTVANSTRFAEGILLLAYSMAVILAPWLGAIVLSSALAAYFFKNRLEGESCK